MQRRTVLHVSTMNESTIQKSIIKWINKQPHAKAENVSGNGKQSGRADINACVNGYCVKIEVKRPDSYYTVTEKQKLYLKKWNRAGAVCISVTSLAEVKELLKPYLED